MTVRSLWLFSAFLVSAPLARLLAGSTEPLGVTSCGEVASRQAVETTTALPSNLEADAVFGPFLKDMWQSSPTFRRQWSRLAARSRLRVKVLPEDRPRPDASSRARTHLSLQDGSVASAQIYLKPSMDAVELIAHEMEHVLEQLDGVDLRVQAGNGVVWQAGDGAFETRRAIEAGLRVAREVRMGPDVRDDGQGPLEPQSDRLTTVLQQDRNASPSSARSARVSGNGRYVAFVSSARLAEADQNQFGDIYVLDLATGQCTLESVGPGGSAGNGESLSPDISRDGRYVTFESAAGNLSDTPLMPGTFRVFLRDRLKGTTRLLTLNMNREPANGTDGNPAINGAGTVVVFESTATDLTVTQQITNRSIGIYLIQLASGHCTRVDLSTDGEQRAGQSMSPVISADGRFVAFVSKADLTCSKAPACVNEPPDKNGFADVYLRDTLTNTTKRMTRGYAGGDLNGPSYHPAISGDGRHVVFVSEASNLTRDTTQHVAQVYVHDLVTGITELVSRTPNGHPANGASLRPVISHDGRRIAFQSLAANLLCERECRGQSLDINLLWDVFVFDRVTRRTIRVSRDDGPEWMEDSRAPSLDDTGRVLAFGSRHPIDERDGGHDEDLYVFRLR